MDVHKCEIAMAICSAEAYSSRIVKSTIFPADLEGLERFWRFLKKDRPCSFAMEVMCIFYHTPYEFLKKKQLTAGWIYDIVVVNPSNAADVILRFLNINEIQAAQQVQR
jgi:hypothetical protein